MSDLYFNKLNYTLANEDNQFEVDLCQKLDPKKLLLVCGSGGRSLPLVSPATETMVCADLAGPQLLLASLREACLRELNFDEYKLFWGFSPYTESAECEKRKKLFARLTLSAECSDFFTKLYEEISWQSLLYLGKWEKTFAKIAKIAQKILGPVHSRKLFEFNSLEEQRAYFRNEFPKWRWRLVLFIVGNATFFNKLLYKGSFVDKNIPDSHFSYYNKAYQHLFMTGLARENFFLQVSFLGRIIFEEGNPAEANAEVFERTKKWLLNHEVDYKQQDIIKLAKEGNERFDYVSLSDVPSYFSGDLEKSFVMDLRPSLNQGAHVVIRSYLRVPEYQINEDFENVSNEFQDLIDQEKTQMYKIDILRYRGEA